MTIPRQVPLQAFVEMGHALTRRDDRHRAQRVGRREDLLGDAGLHFAFRDGRDPEAQATAFEQARETGGWLRGAVTISSSRARTLLATSTQTFSGSARGERSGAGSRSSVHVTPVG